MKIQVKADNGREFPFECPDETIVFQEMVFLGEYNFNFPGEPKVILDVGANCGAFSLWAAQRWPLADVLAYEPSQVNFSFLKKNCDSHPRIKLAHQAVLSSDKEKLYLGKNNQGEASFYLDYQCIDTYEIPEKIHPKLLPDCDILKVDTEGCEVEILTGYLSTHPSPKLIMFEFHSEEDRRSLDALLTEKGYILAGGQVLCTSRGTFKYLQVSE